MFICTYHASIIPETDKTVNLLLRTSHQKCGFITLKPSEPNLRVEKSRIHAGESQCHNCSLFPVIQSYSVNLLGKKKNMKVYCLSYFSIVLKRHYDQCKVFNWGLLTISGGVHDQHGRKHGRHDTETVTESLHVETPTTKQRGLTGNVTSF